MPVMKILIAGGSGFVGRYLIKQLLQQGHEITLLTRQPNYTLENVTVYQWDGQSISTKLENDFDVVINLCGYNIAAKRWSPVVKQQLRDSRLQPSQALVDFLQNKPANKPLRFLSASAIGYYPSTPQQQNEQTAISYDHLNFCQQLSQDWEACAQQASSDNVSVIITRFGVVLGQGGGMLHKLLPSFKFGLGMIMGDRNAYLSWIHISDLIKSINWLIVNDDVSGAYNLTAPHACTQAEFANTLAQTLHRPRLFAMPSLAVKLLFGELGDELLLANQRIVPQHLLDAGFQFEFQTIEQALNNLINIT